MDLLAIPCIDAGNLQIGRLLNLHQAPVVPVLGFGLLVLRCHRCGEFAQIVDLICADGVEVVALLNRKPGHHILLLGSHLAQGDACRAVHLGQVEHLRLVGHLVREVLRLVQFGQIIDLRSGHLVEVVALLLGHPGNRVLLLCRHLVERDRRLPVHLGKIKALRLVGHRELVLRAGVEVRHLGALRRVGVGDLQGDVVHRCISPGLCNGRVQQSAAVRAHPRVGPRPLHQGVVGVHDPRQLPGHRLICGRDPSRRVGELCAWRHAGYHSGPKRRCAGRCGCRGPASCHASTGAPAARERAGRVAHHDLSVSHAQSVGRGRFGNFCCHRCPVCGGAFVRLGDERRLHFPRHRLRAG